MQNSTAAIVSHAPLCHATTAPLVNQFILAPPSRIAQSYSGGDKAMEKLAKHSWPSIDTLVIIVSLTVIGVGIWIMY